MLTLRVHDAQNQEEGETRYLTIQCPSDDSFLLDLQELDQDVAVALPSVTVSREDLYAVLEGHDLVIRQNEASLLFRGDEERLYIHFDTGNGLAARQFQVWMAELSLGFNMLRGNP